MDVFNISDNDMAYSGTAVLFAMFALNPLTIEHPLGSLSAEHRFIMPYLFFARGKLVNPN